MNNKYTIEEVASKLKVSKKTILRMVKRGEVQTQKVGRRYLIEEKELSKYLNKGKNDLGSMMHDFFAAKKGEIVSLLARMVSMPSVTSELNQEIKLAHFIKKTFDKWGVRAVVYQDGQSVAVRATYGYADKGILLDAPLDTLPAGDLSKWKFPPYDGVVKDGKMYGRGTADCKSAIAVIMYTILFFKTFFAEENIRIEVVFDGGEQDGTFLGIKEVVRKGLPVDYGIIGYAGDENDLLIGARGYHRYSFTCHGEAVHTGSRYKIGINAISQMAKFMAEVEKLKFRKSDDPTFNFGTRLTFAMIQGGQAINMVPDRCTARLDIRTIPEIDKNQLDDILAQTILKFAAKDNKFRIDMSYDCGEEAYAISPDNEFVTLCRNAIKAITSNLPGVTASGPAHVGNFLSKYNIPCVVWGPKGNNVHSYNEYIEIDSLPKTCEIYTRIVTDYFKLDSSSMTWTDWS